MKEQDCKVKCFVAMEWAQTTRQPTRASWEKDTVEYDTPVYCKQSTRLGTFAKRPQANYHVSLTVLRRTSGTD